LPWITKLANQILGENKEVYILFFCERDFINQISKYNHKYTPETLEITP
jgi:hypothetical protein